MKKNISRLLVSAIAVDLVNFSPIIFHENHLQNISIVHAKFKMYSATAEDYSSEIENQEIAKLRAKDKAIKKAVEQAGIYLKSYSRTLNSVLTDDEIYTITGAVSEVLKEKPEGMTAEEIYKEIVEKNYYEFHAQNPLNIMVIQIKRACEGVRISKERLVKIFKIVKEVDGKAYYALI